MIGTRTFARTRSEAVALNPDPFPPAIESAMNETTAGGSGLLLWGAPGAGKTVALRVLARRLGARFLTDRAIIDLHRRLMENGLPEETRGIRRDIDALREAAVVAVDDLGSGAAMAYTQWESSVLGDLVDRWYERGTTLLLASNLPLRSLGPVLGARTVSRLVAMVRVVEFRGPDRRIAVAGQPIDLGPTAEELAEREEERRRRALLSAPTTPRTPEEIANWRAALPAPIRQHLEAQDSAAREGAPA